MNKIFQLCFMFSQEIYIKLETSASRKIEFLPVTGIMLDIYFFIPACRYDDLSETKIKDFLIMIITGCFYVIIKEPTNPN